MKKQIRQCISLILAVVMIATSGLYSSGAVVSAAEIDDQGQERVQSVDGISADNEVQTDEEDWQEEPVGREESADQEDLADQEEDIELSPDQAKDEIQDGIAKPAKTVSDTVNNTLVTVEAPEGALEEGWSLTIEEISVESVQSAIKDAAGDDREIANIKAFDISILHKNGEVIQPDGSVNVTFSNMNTVGGISEIYHVEDNKNSAKLVSQSAAGNTVGFQAEHFSLYAYVELKSAPAARDSYDFELEVGEQCILYSGYDSFMHEWKIIEGDTHISLSDPSTESITVQGESAGKAVVKYYFFGEAWGDSLSRTYNIVIKDPSAVNITFDLNKGSGTNPDNISGKSGSYISLPTDQGISREGYVFLGWSDKKDSSGINNNLKPVIYESGGTYQLADEDTVLYAAWAQTEGIANGRLKIAIRTDGIVPAEPSIQDAYYIFLRTESTTVNLLTYFNPVHTVAGIEAVKAVLQPEFYLLVDSYNINNNYWNSTTQYVEWYVIKEQQNDGFWHIDGVVREKAKVHLDYDANCIDFTGLWPNGGEYVLGTSVVIEGKGTLERAGYEFSGWNTQSDGTGELFNQGDEITLTKDVHLYAQWTPKDSTKYIVNYYWQDLQGNYPSNPNFYSEKTATTGTVVYSNTGAGTFQGYTYDDDNTMNIKSGVVKGDGSLVLKRYYKREIVSYTVKYEDVAGSKLLEDKEEKGKKYGETVTEEAEIIAGYNVDITQQSLILGMEDNIIIFKYTPIENIKYRVEVFYENDGYYPLIPDITEVKTGTTGTVAIVSPADYEKPGYMYDMSKDDLNIKESIIKGDGSTVLRLYFKQTFKVSYEWFGLPDFMTFYNQNGERIEPHLPDGITNLEDGQNYVIDNQLPGSVVFLHDDYGNAFKKYTLGEWNDPGNGVMGKQDITVTGEWMPDDVAVAMWNIIYQWDGEIPSGENIQILPNDTTKYINNSVHTVDTKFTEGYTVNNFDDFGNIKGVFTFSGWDTEPGIITEHIEIRGTWTYEESEIARYNVEYSWSGLPAGIILYGDQGDVVVPNIPNSITGLVKNQDYVIDNTITGTVFYTHDQYGNIDGAYTFGGWEDPGNGIMGEQDITVTGVWAFENIKPSTWNITYNWGGDIPDAAILPIDNEEYINNAPYNVDTDFFADYTVVTYDDYGNVIGVYKFSGWDTESGVITENTVINGTWSVERRYTLSINYIYANEGLAFPQYVGTYRAGDTFTVLSPLKDGYIMDYASISSGQAGMPTRDLEFTVVYTEIPSVIPPVIPPVTPVEPEIPSEPETPINPEMPVEPETPINPEMPVEPETPINPEIPTLPETPENQIIPDTQINTETTNIPAAQSNPQLSAGLTQGVSTSELAVIPPVQTPAASIDAEIAENKDGDYELVPVEEEDVPLANLNLEDHDCCILHFLLMLLALITLICYTINMKKRQAKVFELREELELKKVNKVIEKTED